MTRAVPVAIMSEQRQKDNQLYLTHVLGHRSWNLVGIERALGLAGFKKLPKAVPVKVVYQ